MTELPEIGKISPEIFSELIFPRLGAGSDKVLVGPQHGVDVGIVEIGNKVVGRSHQTPCRHWFHPPQAGMRRRSLAGALWNSAVAFSCSVIREMRSSTRLSTGWAVSR